MKWIKENLLPLVIGGIGLILIIFGLLQFVLNKPKSSPLVFEEPKTEKQEVVVDIEGAVLSPGVYKLTLESRIVDALAAAGGMSEDADRQWTEKNINLAKKVSDGLKLYIPRAGEQILSDQLNEANSVININTASATDLESLPGIGAVTAGNIIEARPFAQKEDLLNRKIVGAATFEKIKDKISAD